MTLDWESISGHLYVFPLIINRHNSNNNNNNDNNNNNNNINNKMMMMMMMMMMMLCLPSAVFIALMLVGPSKDSKWRQIKPVGYLQAWSRI